MRSRGWRGNHLEAFRRGFADAIGGFGWLVMVNQDKVGSPGYEYRRGYLAGRKERITSDKPGIYWKGY